MTGLARGTWIAIVAGTAATTVVVASAVPGPYAAVVAERGSSGDARRRL